MAEAQRLCSAGIEEASRVGSALESAARSSGYGQQEAVLAASSRVLEIAPQCTAAQEMRVRESVQQERDPERKREAKIWTEREREFEGVGAVAGWGVVGVVLFW